MSIKMSVHGHNLSLEDPNQGVLTPIGGYARFSDSQNELNWLHAALPTPNTINDQQLTLARVMIRFRMRNVVEGVVGIFQNAEISAVHIYDGERRIAAFDDLALRTVSAPSWQVETFEIPGSGRFDGGIGISLGVKAAVFSIEISSLKGEFELVP